MHPLQLDDFPLTPGRRLIEASAGTGKTFTITSVYVRLLLGLEQNTPSPERALTVEQILVVTFTDAATNELRLRILQRIQQTQYALLSGVSDEPFIQSLAEQITDRDWAIRCLEAVANLDKKRLCAALATDFFAWPVEKLAQLSTDTPLLEEIIQHMQRWQAQWLSQGVLPMLRSILFEQSIAARLLSENERKLTNILHLAEQLQLVWLPFAVFSQRPIKMTLYHEDQHQVLDLSHSQAGKEQAKAETLQEELRLL